jgi:ABC-type arginine transport system permease subunit
LPGNNILRREIYGGVALAVAVTAALNALALGTVSVLFAHASVKWLIAILSPITAVLRLVPGLRYPVAIFDCHLRHS